MTWNALRNGPIGRCEALKSLVLGMTSAPQR